jgi:zinc protease
VITSWRTPHRRSVPVLAAVVGLVLAACTASSDVAEIESNPLDTSPPVSTLAPSPLDGSTPVTAPDPNGLPSVTEPDPAITIGELDNGLRYLIRDNDNPGRRVEMRLVVDAGSALEDETQIGGAHFLEHMLFNGTEQFPENELIAVLRSFGAAFGADINAYTSFDETVYQLTMSTEDAAVVDTGLDVLSQWLSAATIDQAQVEAERGIVLDEWRIRSAGSDGRVFDGLEELLLAGSPYEDREPIGTVEAIEAMDAEPLRTFYDDWYRPDNAAVIVVGDIDPETIEQGIVDRFGPLVARGSSPERPELLVTPSSEPQVVVVSDPDIAEGFAQVTLPATPTEDLGPEAALQVSLLDALAFDIIATRLGNDALRGEAPFDDARVDSSGFVRGLDAPEIVVSADGDSLEASTQAVFDEYERVRRFGFTTAEVERAVSSVRAGVDSFYEGRDSRQDADFAEEYVRHVLVDEPIPTAEVNFEILNVILDRATPETVAYGFVDRLASTGAHVMVVVPETEAGELPGEDAWIAQALDMRDRDLEPRAEEAGVDGALMVAPEPVEEVASDRLADGSAVSFVAPTVLEFSNGVTVSLNSTNIVDGQVAFEARSPGGRDVLDDTDLPAATAAGPVVRESGVATYDSVALDAFLADKDVELQLGIDPFAERMFGSAATSDLEVLFQLIHLFVTQSRVDPVALDQYLDDQMPFAADPSIEPGYAEFEALLEARYDDPAFLLPTVESLNSVTVDDIDRVFRDRFGDASDFAFAFSGDIDIDDATDLARSYLATLPSTGRTETVDHVEPPPPAGVVTDQVSAGRGEQASVSFLFTAPASADRRDDIAAQVVQEILTNRLTDAIREDLGESYSPFAVVNLGAGAAPYADTYISNTTAADLVVEVEQAVLAQLADLRDNGPSPAERAAASEAIRQQLELFSNEQINAEVLAVLTDPAGNASIDAFLGQARLLDGLDVDAYLRAWLPADRYIEVTVLPK